MGIRLRIPWHRLLPRHQRVLLFWILAGLGIAAPWLLEGSIRVPWPIGATESACIVQSIHDGDTLRARCGGGQTKIRLYCIDAPEMGQRPWGTESRDHLRRIAAHDVHLIEHDRDRYGRIVGELHDPASGASLNLAMVAAGQAAVYPRYCRDARFFRAQDAARSAGLGIWARPGEQQRPWEWRHRR